MNNTYTEQEAKERWCPFARGILDSGGNRMGFGATGGEPNVPDCQEEYGAAMADLYPCIASQCMAWRWADNEEGEPAYSRTPLKGSPGHFDNAPLGYCGLADKP